MSLMEASQCHTSHLKTLLHHFHSTDSSRKDRWTTGKQEIQKKPIFRSKQPTYTESLSPNCWSLEDFAKHGHSDYSHSFPTQTLKQSRSSEPSTDDELSASWSSSSTTGSSLSSPDLNDQGRTGWLVDFCSYSSPSPSLTQQQHKSPIPTHSSQQCHASRYTYYSPPHILPISTSNTHSVAIIQDKSENWEMAFDCYENKEYSHRTTPTTIIPITAQVGSSTCLLEMESKMTAENEINNALDVFSHGTKLKGKEGSGTQQTLDHGAKSDDTDAMDMDAADWNKIGMDLQETEQDIEAIDAFKRAVALDVNMLDAWLNLAISYTNEHQRGNAYDCLEAWIQHNDKYQHIAGLNNEFAEMTDRNTALVEKFILAARCAPGDTLDTALSLKSLSTSETPSPTSNEVDADVQVILGLLFYLADETRKSTDCFRTALACRPDDHRLWNQLGSVMLSQQQDLRALETSCDGAMDMYWSALYLNPEYTRARYNLAVVHMKLSQYEQAAHHLVTALTHQQKQQQRQRSLMVPRLSSPMWSSLRLVMYMLNLDDLADACNQYDLTPFVSFLTPTSTYIVDL